VHRLGRQKRWGDGAKRRTMRHRNVRGGVTLSPKGNEILQNFATKVTFAFREMLMQNCGLHPGTSKSNETAQIIYKWTCKNVHNFYIKTFETFISKI
jgi:hypothetical protein